MKLRNKKTGEIMEFDAILPVKDVTGNSVAHLEYSSLAELNAEWEDYEEPKEYWYIAYNGSVGCFEYDDDWQYMDFNWQDKLKQIGNYFETKEEAEKTVEKLKAWKRLKDKGFVFKGINMDNGSIKTGLSKGVSLDECEEFYDDMNLLFGGKE